MATGFEVSREGSLATITIQLPGKVNKINAEFGRGLADAWAQTAGATGVLVVSGHKDFCVGADLDMIHAQTDPAAVLELVRSLDQLLRMIETSGVPVACVLAGSALGTFDRLPILRTLLAWLLFAAALIGLFWYTRHH